jgi:hypothetical protein
LVLRLSFFVVRSTLTVPGSGENGAGLSPAVP